MKAKNKDIELTNKSGLDYQGKVTVKIQNGKKVLKTKTYHNNGTDLLFKYLCTCLAVGSSYNISEELRPIKLMLFVAASGETPQSVEHKWSSNEQATPFIVFDSTPTSSKNAENAMSEEGVPQWTVTYHFRVPYAFIQNQKNKICKAALYSSAQPGILSDYDNMSAYFFFTKDKEGSTTGEKEWDPLVISGSNNYSLIIDWTMIITNKQ